MNTQILTLVLAAIAAALSLFNFLFALSMRSSSSRKGGDIMIKRSVEDLSAKITAMNEANNLSEQRINARLAQSEAATEARLNSVREKLDGDLRYIAQTNNENLEKIRRTVDEKMTATLEGKLGENYNLINQRLDAVSKGIGEVHALAGNVNDIKKLFSNVKLRGTWGEVQLNALLEQMLSSSQYAASVKVNPNANVMVDFAVKIPSKDDKTVYLPIDSKFPVEEYIRLLDAEDRETAERASKNLERAVKLQADSIAQKYIAPPYTTDFAVMYLPLEGLYAEVVKMPSLEGYLREKRVLACGPTNLGALLSTLQTGFKTVAIEKRSGELWQLLSAFKSEFEKFGAIFEKTQKKLREAQEIVETAGKKTATISRKLKNVADIGDDEAELLLSDEGEND